MKNATKIVTLIAHASLAGPMSYDNRRKDLYWVGRDEREQFQVESDANEFRWRIHVKNVQEVSGNAPRIFQNLSTPSKLAPKFLEYWKQRVMAHDDLFMMNLELQKVPLWIEYDWVGDNIFFKDIEVNIGVCGRIRAECAIISNYSTESLKDANGIALDPPRG